MKRMFLMISLFVTIWSTSSSSNNPTRFVCYFLSWAMYRTGPRGVGRFTVDNIDPNLCTHVLYAFARIDSETYKIKINDDRADIYNKGYEKFVALKIKNPNLKVMISVQGFTPEVDRYSQLVTNNSNIDAFVESAVAFLKLYKFDGLDWNHWTPSSGADAPGYANLMVALKTAFRPHGYLLSSIGSAFQIQIDVVAKEDVERLNENLDFLNVWTIGYYKAETKSDSADHHAPLFQRSWDVDDQNTAAFAVNYWIRKGMSPDKILLGIPLSGQSWKLTSEDITPPALAAGAGAPGKFTTEAGFMAYYEICDAVNSAGWTEIQDPSGAMGPYAVSSNSPKIWVGYDDPAMAVVKSKYVLSKNLGGVFVWSVDFDDFRNICGGGVNPILTAISKTLKGQEFIPMPTSKKWMNSTINSEESGFCECVCQDPM